MERSVSALEHTKYSTHLQVFCSCGCCPTSRSAIRSLETTHRDSFAWSMGDERESSKEQATLHHPIEATDWQIDVLVPACRQAGASCMG